jgi:hypothetical protein
MAGYEYNCRSSLRDQHKNLDIKIEMSYILYNRVLQIVSR